MNGVEDTNGDLIPCRNSELWEPVIDLDQGIIINWDKPVHALIHYKVCDEGEYELCDESMQVIDKLEGYVPTYLAPCGNGFGDYIILDVDESGAIKNWSTP